MHLAAHQIRTAGFTDAGVISPFTLPRSAASSVPMQRSSARSWLSSTLTSYLSARKPGRCLGSAGSHPHLSHLYCGTPAGFFAPHSEQNLPLFTAPQEHFQPSSAGMGLGLPHSGQNFPLTVAPQLHFQLSPAGLGSGFLLPQLGQKLPVMPLWPQDQVQPCTVGAGAGCAACCICCCCWPIWKRLWAFMPPA